MYCFKLIKNESLHTGKGKIIPKEEFETLLTAEELLQKIEDETNDIVEEAKKESTAIKEKAHEEGFQEGLVKFNEQLLLFEDKLKILKHELQKSVLPLVLQATKKIVGEELSLAPEAIVSIVMQSIKSVVQSKTVKLYVNRSEEHTSEL